MCYCNSAFTGWKPPLTKGTALSTLLTLTIMTAHLTPTLTLRDPKSYLKKIKPTPLKEPADYPSTVWSLSIVLIFQRYLLFYNLKLILVFIVDIHNHTHVLFVHRKVWCKSYVVKNSEDSVCMMLLYFINNIKSYVWGIVLILETHQTSISVSQ